MPSCKISTYWQELHERQFEWAFRAYRQLIKTLSEDVQGRLSLQDETAQPYVVIFGKTQVGKTTLLLDLMGVDPKQMHIISEVMRGGREQGKSATATAMEYVSSTNERWGLSLQKKTCWLDSDQAMKQALGQVREEMESGQLVAETPCVVHIPKRFFSKGNANAPKVRILDLPGDNPASEQEQKHVNQMAKTYLPFADLILLVGRGDDLGFLKPEVVTLPGIEDWQAMPHRFRIVTTYSYTAQSVKDILRCNPTADESLLRRRLIQEIERFGVMSETARTEALYFPLEFGNSWMGAQVNEPELHSRMSPIITRLRAELLKQIADSITPMGRLESTLNTYHSVQYIQKKKIAEVEDQYNKLARKKVEIDKGVVIWGRTVERARTKLSKVDSMLKSQSISDNELLIKRAVNRPRYASALVFPPELRGKKDDKKTLQNLIYDYYEILSKLQLEVIHPDSLPASRSYWREIKKRLLPLEYHVIRSTLDDEFGSIRSKLSEYWIDTYIISENFQKDLMLVRKSGEAAQQALMKLREDSWLAALNTVHNNYLSDRHIARCDLAEKESELDNSRQQQARVQAEQSALYVERWRIMRRSAEDLERCKRFESFLDKEYLSELSERMVSLLENSDDCDSLLQLLSCVELKYQREALMNLNEQRAF